MLISATVTFPAQSLRADIAQAWEQRYGYLITSAQDYPSRVVRDAAGDLFVGGYTEYGINGQDMLLIKLSGTSGTIIWKKRYDRAFNNEPFILEDRIDLEFTSIFIELSIGFYVSIALFSSFRI